MDRFWPKVMEPEGGWMSKKLRDAYVERLLLGGAPMMLGFPESLLDHHWWACENGHVSDTILKSEVRGDLCLAGGCGSHVWMVPK